VRNAGCCVTVAPTPNALSINSAHHPTGTPHTNGMAWRKPACAPMAADNVVLGPGVKLAAVAKAMSAVSSEAFM